MKRIPFLLLLLTLVVSCGKQKTPLYHIGVSQCSSDLWRETANRELLMEASFYPELDLEILSANANSEAQIKDIEYFVSKDVDLLIVSPNEAEALTSVISEAYKSGIPVILWDRKTNSEDYSAYVGADNNHIGRSLGDYLLNNYEASSQKNCNIVILRGQEGSTADQERYEGFISVLASNEGVINPKIVGEEYAHFLKPVAFSKFSELLRTDLALTRIDAVVAFNDQMAIGAREALDSCGRADNALILGVDAVAGQGGGVEAIQNGRISASFIYPSGAETVIEVAMNILGRKAYQKNNFLNSEVVNSRNVHVTSIQSDLIEDRQEKIDILSRKLGYLDKQMRVKTSLTTWLCVLIGLIVIIAALLIMSNRATRRLNNRLNEKNAQIQKQVDELEVQKKQLTDISCQLEDAAQAKMVFFTNISHEFRTPLTLILGPVEEILSRNDLDVETHESLTIVRKNVDKLLSLINEILDFRTCENGKISPNYQIRDYKSFIENVNALFNDISRRKQIRFKTNFEDGDYKLPMDSNLFEKIYFNLLSNAFKYVKVGGQVDVNVSQEKKTGERNIRIEVFNTDSYIPQESINEIFQRFYKLDANTQDSSGIGLALTASLVEVLGGKITAESSVDKGTSFIIVLPVDDSILPLEGGDLPDEFVYSQRQMHSIEDFSDDSPLVDDSSVAGRSTVLLVEDNLDMLHYLKSVLSSEYRVILATNGQEGVNKAVKYMPQIVISDVMMPQKDGFELCRELKENQKTSGIPVVLLTACALDDQRVKGYECGADAYIEKPFSSQVLKVRIQNLIGKSHTADSSSAYRWLTNSDGEISSDSAVILDKFQHYVEDHIEDEIGIDDIAAELGLSKSKLYRKLSEITEYSPVDMVNLIRLRKAVNLIVYGRKNFSEAAFESGFSSLSYFSRVFVKYYKDTPRAWIKKTYGKL